MIGPALQVTLAPGTTAPGHAVTPVIVTPDGALNVIAFTRPVGFGLKVVLPPEPGAVVGTDCWME